MEDRLFTKEQEILIAQILKKGHDVEIKKVRGQMVIIELHRKLKSKSPL